MGPRTLDDAQLVKVLKALAEPKRFKMVQTIAAAGEISCGQLAESFDLSQPTISHHLKLLTEAGILLVRHEGQHHFMSVNRPLLEELGGLLPSRLAVAEAPKPRRAAR